tara:strand:+ start:16448 stop:16639 length:192 start_codon:yes stop_codon:yes gene_type:complete
VNSVALDNGVLNRHWLTLATADGLVQVVVEEASTIRFTDSDIDEQVAAALVAVAKHRLQDRVS